MPTLNEDFEEKSEEELEKEALKQQKIDRERQILLENVIAVNIKTDRDRVGFILNTMPETRNSDVDLAWAYWEMYEENFDGEDISKEQFRKYKCYKSIHRQRAHIQNEYGLFLANQKVRLYRGVLAEEKKKEAIEETRQVVSNAIEVYIDESGKVNQNLTVGGLWISDMRSKFFGSRKLKEWIKLNEINYEFHFAKLSRHRLQDYKDFFTLFMSSHPTASFKVIVVDKKGNSNLNETYTDLTFHLLYKGIKQEDESGRAELPRRLLVHIDEEEEGSDQIKIENIKERLSRKDLIGLFIDEIATANSKDNFYVQVVDLFVSSVNRKLHPETSRNHKDELADFILSILGFNASEYNHNSDVDSSIVFDLTR
jgi:hypothetical protein